MAILNKCLACNTFIWMCMLSQIHASVALPTTLQDEEGAGLVELMPRDKHISFTSEMLEQNGTENERNKRSSSELKDCDEDQLLSYLRDIQDINPDSVINLTTKKNISHLCKKVAASMKTMDGYIKICKFLDENDSYLSLIRGVKTLYVRMCKTGSFQTEFMKYLSCYYDLYDEYDSCVSPDNWMENTGQKFICRMYHHLEECYYNVTLQTCGKNAARSMKKFIGWVTDSVIMVTCDNMRHSDEFEADTQPQDALDVSPEITGSMNPLLAAYICAGVSLTVIMILVLYFFVTRLCKFSCANGQE